MATVSGMTAEAIKAILAQILVSAQVDEQGQIIFKTRGGNEINAGPVISPKVAIDRAYPVGSIYMNTAQENPGTLLGVGTWVRFGNGRVLVGVDENVTEFNAPLKTGGAASVALSTANLPKHAHTVPAHSHAIRTQFDRSVTLGGGGLRVTDVGEGTGGGGTTGTGNTASQAAQTTSETGSNAAHNNLQPYITVYMWRRTA